MSRHELLLALGEKMGDAGREELTVFILLVHAERRGSQ